MERGGEGVEGEKEGKGKVEGMLGMLGMLRTTRKRIGVQHSCCQGSSL
jgi:hypothetical protein